MIVTGPVDPHQAGGDAYLRELVALRRELGLEDAVAVDAHVIAALAGDEREMLPGGHD